MSPRRSLPGDASYLRHRTEHRSLEKKCLVPLQCTPVLYFSTSSVGPTETAHYDKFPFGKGDATVCQKYDAATVITVAGLSAACRWVIDTVEITFTSPLDFQDVHRVDKKVRGRPFTVFGDRDGGVGWNGVYLTTGEYTVELLFRGAGDCVLSKTVNRFFVKDTRCLRTVLPPCNSVLNLPNLPKSTLAALKNSSSPQFRAYKWVLANRNRLQVNASRCLYEMTHRFATYTVLLDAEREAISIGHPSANETLEFDLYQCQWGYMYDSMRYLQLLWRITPRPLPMELLLATDLNAIEAYQVSSDDRIPLIGTFPTEFGRLTRLTALSFDSYDGSLVGGTLPSELGLLTQLGYLFLRGQPQLVGPIPTEIGLLSSLGDLTLERTNLDGTLPTELTVDGCSSSPSHGDVPVHQAVADSESSH